MKRKGDIYVLGITQIGLLVFLLISCSTIYSGLMGKISPYLATWSGFWVALASIAIFGIFSFGPDYINSRIIRYITRTFLQGEWKDSQSLILLAGCMLLIVALTRYSYNMSKVSAISVTADVVGAAKEKDTSPIDQAYRMDQDKISQGLEAEKASITTNYERLIQAESAPFKTKIEREETRIAGLEKGWAKDKASRIRSAKSNISYYQSEIAKIEAKYREEGKTEFAGVESRYFKKDSLLTAIYLSNRDTTLLRNGVTVVNHQSIKSFLTAQIGSIAGNAVFFYLILSIMLEIVYFRNDMHPNPIYSPFDFKPSAALEVLALPFVWAGRHTFNYARRVYNELPDVEIRKDWKEITDMGESQTVHAKKAETTAITIPATTKKKRALKPETTPKSEGKKAAQDSDATHETTKFQTETYEFETMAGVLGQIDKRKRNINSYIWKLNNRVGRPETCLNGIRNNSREIMEIATKYTGQIQHDTGLVTRFESILATNGTYECLQKAKGILKV